MMKMKVSAKKIELPFKHPFTISKATKTHQPTFIVELEYFGIKGYGEAPAISYYNITTDQMLADLESKKRLVEQFALTDPERYWHYLHHLFPKNPFLVCALDMAGWDIWGKLKQMPLHKFWNLDVSKMPVTDYTIGIDSTEKMLEKLHETPWPVYKIKMGFEEDLKMIQSLRSATDKPFRVDVNAGWNLEEAKYKIDALQELNIEFVEQPTEKYNAEIASELFAVSKIPLIADESCVDEKDVDTCAANYHGVNIKLTKCSGITPARRMLKSAKEKGLKTMLGCMNESSLGTAALLHLSPDADYLDADGPLLLSQDVCEGLVAVNGMYVMPNSPGLGVVIEFDQL